MMLYTTDPETGRERGESVDLVPRFTARRTAIAAIDVRGNEVARIELDDREALVLWRELDDAHGFGYSFAVGGAE